MISKLKVIVTLGIFFLLTGCMAAGPIAGAVLAPVLMQKAVTKSSESKPPKYIELQQQGRIITASFEVKGFVVGLNQSAQMRGFHSWATAAVVREASKLGCVNVVNALSANQGTTAQATIGSTKFGNSLKFKCLEKETIASEQDPLADKLAIYGEQIEYLNQNPEIIRYTNNESS